MTRWKSQDVKDCVPIVSQPNPAQPRAFLIVTATFGAMFFPEQRQKWSCCSKRQTLQLKGFPTSDASTGYCTIWYRPCYFCPLMTEQPMNGGREGQSWRARSEGHKAAFLPPPSPPSLLSPPSSPFLLLPLLFSSLNLLSFFNFFSLPLLSHSFILLLFFPRLPIFIVKNNEVDVMSKTSAKNWKTLHCQEKWSSRQTPLVG